MRRALLTALLLAWSGLAAAAPRTLAVLSLIGDKIEVVVPQMETGSRLDPTRRSGLGDGSGAFDKYTLKAAQEAIGAVDLGIGVVLIGLAPSELHDRPERLFDADHVVLPGLVVDELERVGAHHLLLITKHRSAVNVPFERSTAGIGSVRGLGFYLDPVSRVRMVESGDTAAGFLAPFAYFMLTLADARSGKVLREQAVHLMETLPVAQFPGANDPWNVIDARAKVERLQRLIRRGLRENLGGLLKGL